MSEIIIKTAESAVTQDRNGRNYKRVTFETLGKAIVNHPIVGRVIADVPKKSTKINIYENSYLNNQEEFGYSSPVGSKVLGNIVTRKVEAYDITNQETGETRTVNSYTTIVFGDTDTPDFEVAVERAFKNASHPLVEFTPANIIPETV